MFFQYFSPPARLAQLAERSREGGSRGSKPLSCAMAERNDIEEAIVSTMMERPLTFSIDGDTRLSLYPPSLGVTYLVAPIISTLGFDTEKAQINASLELVRVCGKQKDDVCRILSLYSFRRHADLFDDSLVTARMKIFAKLDASQLATLLQAVLNWNDIQPFIKHVGLDKEAKQRERVAALQKKSSKTMSFGGRSVYGSLIDYACQRYGWTMQYVVWGISYANLQMLIADAVNTAYLTDEESKKLGLGGNDKIIDADDPRNAAMIRQMFGG